MSLIAPPQAPATTRPRIRWTSAEFDQLVAAGFLREGGREYLWDGEIIKPMPEDPDHVQTCESLVDALKDLLPREAWAVNSGRPILLADGFVPQPDVVVLIGPRSAYRKRRPVAADAALVVEVANTSYPEDAGEYLRHYALAGIPLYWIVNIRGRRVEAYSVPRPEEGRYEVSASFGLGELVPLTLDAGGHAATFGGVAVEAILRDSLTD